LPVHDLGHVLIILITIVYKIGGEL